MPKQETFFEEITGDLKIEVIKTYDHAFAREAFDGMGDVAQAHLWQALGIDNLYDETEVPPKPMSRVAGISCGVKWKMRRAKTEISVLSLL